MLDYLRLNTTTDIIDTVEDFLSGFESINASKGTFLIALNLILRTRGCYLVLNGLIKLVPAVASVPAALEQYFKGYILLDVEAVIMTAEITILK